MSLRIAIEQCFKNKSITEQGLEAQYILCAESAIFAGHFPQNPILPAVVQCLMVQMLVEEMLGIELGVFDIDDAKLMAPVIPPCTVRVSVQKGRKEGVFTGVVAVGETLHAKIVLRQSQTV